MKAIVFLAEGFEEVEALTVVDYLRRKDIGVDTVSITQNNMVKGAHDITLIADKKIDDINNLDRYDGAIIPGGMPGAINLRDNARVIEILSIMNKDDKMVAAICAGPIVLQRAGIIAGKKSENKYQKLGGDLWVLSGKYAAFIESSVSKLIKNI